jgi:Cu-Zn family superoxide dismutase
MKRCLAALILLAGCHSESAPASLRRAHAKLVDGRQEAVGTAFLEEGGGGVRITLDLHGLPPGEHGFHIHENGACHGPSFESGGAHFNPHGRKHGLMNPEGPHAGDLPNLVIGADGRHKGVVLAPLVTLGAGRHSLLKPGGTCLVIHANADDGRSDPAGKAGDRLACGVILAESGRVSP